MGFFDDILGKTAAEKQSKNFKSGISQLSFAQDLSALGKEEIGGLLQALLGQIAGGYDKAISGVSGAASGAKQAIQDQGQRATGSLQSSMIDRGLYNTTAALNAERGVAADVGRGLADVDSNVAALMANLQMGKTNALAAGTTNLANFLQGNLGQQVGLFGSKANAYLGREIPQKYGGLMSGLGAVGGSIFGPSGAALGGKLAGYLGG